MLNALDQHKKKRFYAVFPVVFDWSYHEYYVFVFPLWRSLLKMHVRNKYIFTVLFPLSQYWVKEINEALAVKSWIFMYNAAILRRKTFGNRFYTSAISSSISLTHHEFVSIRSFFLEQLKRQACLLCYSVVKRSEGPLMTFHVLNSVTTVFFSSRSSESENETFE